VCRGVSIIFSFLFQPISAVFSAMAAVLLASCVRALHRGSSPHGGASPSNGDGFGAVCGGFLAATLYSFSGGVWEFSGQVKMELRSLNFLCPHLCIIVVVTNCQADVSSLAHLSSLPLAFSQAEVFALNNFLVAFLLRLTVAALIANRNHTRATTTLAATTFALVKVASKTKLVVSQSGERGGLIGGEGGEEGEGEGNLGVAVARMRSAAAEVKSRRNSAVATTAGLAFVSGLSLCNQHTSVRLLLTYHRTRKDEAENLRGHYEGVGGKGQINDDIFRFDYACISDPRFDSDSLLPQFSTPPSSSTTSPTSTRVHNMLGHLRASHSTGRHVFWSERAILSGAAAAATDSDDDDDHERDGEVVFFLFITSTLFGRGGAGVLFFGGFSGAEPLHVPPHCGPHQGLVEFE
jgi:hypothetical protein